MNESDRRLMKEAIEESKQSKNEDDRNHPKVGAIIVKDGAILARAHRGEIPGSHAEYVALRKIEEDISLEDATIYTTLEPCTDRNHPKISCAERIIIRKVGHVVIGMLDPNPDISGKGVRFLRKSGLKVTFFSDDLMKEVEELNKDFDSQFDNIKLATEKQTLDSFQRHLNSIYINNHKLSVEYVYGYLHRTVDLLLMNIARNSYDDDKFLNLKSIDFIRPISWLFALATKLGVNMQTAFFTKYPNACPYCLEDICQCSATGKQPKPRLDAVLRKTTRIPNTYEINKELSRKYDVIKDRYTFGFDYGIKVISSVYPLNKIIWKQARTPYPHIIKIIEELSEVHEAVSRFVKGKTDANHRLFSEELADVLAWLLSAWDIIFPATSLDAALFNYYLNGCPTCSQKPCTCGLYEGHSGNIITMETVKTVKDHLSQLLNVVDVPVIKELITSLAEVEKTQSDGQVRLCFREISYQLEVLEKSFKASDALFKDLISINHNILRIIDPIIEKDDSYFFSKPSKHLADKW